MTKRDLYEIEITGTTDDTNVALSSEIDFIDDDETDSAIFKVLSNYTVVVNDELDYYDYNNTVIFSGVVREINNNNPKELIVYKYDILLDDRLVNDVFEGYTIEGLIEYIVTNYSTLTFSSTFVSGITIDRYVAKNKSARTVIRDLIALVPNLTYDVSILKVFSLFLKNDTTSTEILTNGDNCEVLNGWTEDTSKQVTRLTLIGEKQVQQNKVESFNGTGSQTDFVISEIPSAIKVEVGGVEQTLQVDGQTTGDYTVSPETKTIVFQSGSIPPSGTNNVVVTYNFEIDITIEYDAPLAIQNKYGIIEDKITKKYINKMDDAFNYASQYVEKFGSPLENAKIIKTDSLNITNLTPGYAIPVIDNINTIDGSNIDNTYTIKSLKRKFPSGELIITVGELGISAIDILNEAKYNVRQLYEQDNNSSIIQKSQLLTEDITQKFDADVNNIIKRTYASDTFYLEEDSLGTRNQMLESGLGPVMREVGYTEITLTGGAENRLIEDGTNNRITEGGDIRTTEVPTIDVINASVVTATYQNIARTSFINTIDTNITHVGFGDDDTTPTAGDTTLGNETYRDALFTSNKTNVSFTFDVRLDETENNGNDIKEIGPFDASSGGNLYSHILVTTLSKTSSKIVYYRNIYNFKVLNTTL